MRGLAHAAALTGLSEIAERITHAETRLRQGGVLQSFPLQEGPADRADLERHFGDWMAQAAEMIARQPAGSRDDMRKELYGYAADIARDLGDRRGAELMTTPPRTALYGTAWGGHGLSTQRSSLVQAGGETGLVPGRLEHRFEAGAANAFEERRWLADDLRTLAARKQLDLQQAREPAFQGGEAGRHEP